MHLYVYLLFTDLNSPVTREKFGMYSTKNIIYFRQDRSTSILNTSDAVCTSTVNTAATGNSGHDSLAAACVAQRRGRAVGEYYITSDVIKVFLKIREDIC